MDESGPPANNNTALSQFLQNPKRDLAVKTLEQMITLLDEASVPRHMVADLLFDQVTELVVPEGEIDPNKATIWYAQLNRIRDQIQGQIALIEAELDKVP